MLLSRILRFALWFPLLMPVAAMGQQATGQTMNPDPIEDARAALAAAEAAHPGDTQEVADALILLVQRQTIARHLTPETLELARRAVTVSERATGKQSILYAQSLAALAKAHQAFNHPELGRPIAEEAVEIAQKAAPGTLALAEVADALGKLCWALGDKPSALHAEEIAVANARAAHAKDELYLASMLQDLAQTRMATGDLSGTRAAVEESLAIVDRQAEPTPATATLENNAAAFYIRVGETDKALAHLNKAFDLSVSLYGSDSIHVGYAANNLAELYVKMGRFDDAWPQFERSLALNRKWYGPRSPWTNFMEASYASVLATVGHLPQALDLALEAHDAQREYLSLAIRVMPERQALALSEDATQSLNVLLSIVARHPDIASQRVYQEEIRSRALVTEEMAQRQADLNRKNDPEVAALVKQLDEQRSALLASRQSRQTGDGKTDVYDEATARMERIERSLAERSAAFRAGQRTRAVEVDDVRRHLPPKSVLVSYVAYSRVPVEAGKPGTPGRPAYLAFVLHPDSSRIRAFDLGDARPIEDLVNRARASADAEAHGGGLGSTRNARAFRDAGQALRKQVWDPLRSELSGAALALVVPDGVLNLIPFASLPDGKGYLVEHGPVIHMLTSERDLIPAEAASRKTGLLAIGSPTFDLAAILPPDPLRDAVVSCDAFREMEFHPLPGSAAEVIDINSSWQRWNRREPSALVTGAEATRDRFLTEASRNRVLHVATHAFLLDRSCGSGNPLLHSGLVFAGANQSRGSSILTAQQIASLDLSGVDWAVLSACNTGNGELHDGEGVLGLERAFRVAGARSVVMTLWPVDDDVTRQFMHLLYSERLGRHASTADAVWNSARKLLLDRRATGRSTHPWYWAGFVGSGGWE